MSCYARTIDLMHFIDLTQDDKLVDVTAQRKEAVTVLASQLGPMDLDTPGNTLEAAESWFNCYSWHPVTVAIDKAKRLPNPPLGSSGLLVTYLVPVAGIALREVVPRVADSLAQQSYPRTELLDDDDGTSGWIIRHTVPSAAGQSVEDVESAFHQWCAETARWVGDLNQRMEDANDDLRAHLDNAVQVQLVELRRSQDL